MIATVDGAEPDRTGAVNRGRSTNSAPVPFDEFYRLEFRRLLVLARALVGMAYAEDVAQESLLVAYRRWYAITSASG